MTLERLQNASSSSSDRAVHMEEGSGSVCGKTVKCLNCTKEKADDAYHIYCTPKMVFFCSVGAVSLIGGGIIYGVGAATSNEDVKIAGAVALVAGGVYCGISTLALGAICSAWCCYFRERVSD